MIRYAITLTDLEQRVDAKKATWRTRAAERTAEFVKQGKYEEDSGIWSEIKSVYMTLQHEKCAFCERQLESVEHGTIEQDVEHFRPKKKSFPGILLLPARLMEFRRQARRRRTAIINWPTIS